MKPMLPVVMAVSLAYTMPAAVMGVETHATYSLPGDRHETSLQQTATREMHVADLSVRDCSSVPPGGLPGPDNIRVYLEFLSACYDIPVAAF